MKLAFALFKYFPYGGLQRDFLRVIQQCHTLGHEIHVFTQQWNGEKPDFVNIHLIQTAAQTNHGRAADFSKQLGELIKSVNFDRVIGFNKMDHLDIYYAADSCFITRPRYQNHWLRRLTSRYRTYAKLEKSVFSRESKTDILLISPPEKINYETAYQTQPERLHLLPPGINRDRERPDHYERLRETTRSDLDIKPNDFMLLSIGSSYHTKGIDRTLNAIALLPETLKSRVQFFIIGVEKQLKKYQTLSEKLDIHHHCHFLGSRDDIPRFLFAADLLVHAARIENTGTAILEAIVAGLPVIATENCGYASYITEANAGTLIPADATATTITNLLEKQLEPALLKAQQASAIHFSEKADLFSLIEHIVEHITKN